MPEKPTPGRIVHWVTKGGSGVEHAAVIVRTRDTLIPGVEEDAKLVDDFTVRLEIFGLHQIVTASYRDVGDFRHRDACRGPEVAGTWHYPVRR